MTISQILTALGLLLDIIGAAIIIWRSATRYFISCFSKKVRSEIEEEAIGTSFNRLGSNDRKKMLADPYVQGFISTYRSSFWGFILIIAGFILQLIGNMIAS